MADGLGYGKIKLVDEIIRQNWEIKEPRVKNYSYNDLLFILQEILTEEGKAYSDGRKSMLLGHQVFRSFTEYLLYRNLANYDSMILLTSEKGTGKSSAAMMLAREWCRLLGIRFDPKRHIAYNNADVMNKIDNLKKFEPIICDESIRFACLEGNTIIKTPNGNVPIKKLEGKKYFQVISFNEQTQQEEIQTAEQCIQTKVDLIYELETECGKIIHCTKEHKFLTSDGWKELNELIINDILINNYRIKQIKKLVKTPVYDIINVNKNNNYIANNFIVHNSSEDWAKKENKELKKKLGQVRTKHLLYILCFPLKLYKLEKTYLESYVNYWCLTGDTKILIKDRFNMIRNYPIKELRFQKNYQVASYNLDKKEIEYVYPEKCIKTKKQAEIYEIELENGIKIKCTEEHQFLTEEGIYKKLKDLTTEDKLIINTKKCFEQIKIKSIKKLKEKEDVYDIIGVPNNHNYIANNIVVHNCDLFGRGVGAIYVKDRNPVMDTWRMSEFKNVGSYTEFSNINFVRERLKRHPNFWQIIKFPKPPKWLYTKYLKVREKNVYDDDNILSNVSKEDIYRALLILALRDIMMNDVSLTMNRIILHIKNEYDLPLNKSHIQDIVEDSKQLINKIKEDQQYKV